jgi:hypothetical protein
MKKVGKKLRLDKTLVKYLTVDIKDPRRGALAQVVGADSRYPVCPTTHTSGAGD